jgi:hypothetical protein
MDEGVRIVSLRRSESFGLGFSILGGAGSELPPIIYDIIEDSPAAESGEVRPQIALFLLTPRHFSAHQTCSSCIKTKASALIRMRPDLSAPRDKGHTPASDARTPIAAAPTFDRRSRHQMQIDSGGLRLCLFLGLFYGNFGDRPSTLFKINADDAV